MSASRNGRNMLAQRGGMARWASNFHIDLQDRARAQGWRCGSKKGLRRARRRYDKDLIKMEL